MLPIRYGKYELLERIARGGMAEIYKAKAIGAAGFQKFVAIKKLHAHLSEDIEMVNMLKDEARLVSNMIHPNICGVLDLGKVDDTYYIAMEFIDGKDLSTIAKAERDRNSKIPLDIALYIVRNALTGLDFAHRMADPVTGNPLNIIHRDISPQNILLSYNGAVKIIDFGIAKAAQSLHHTQSGVIKGKFRYMAKEQASGWDIDHRIDIFAAGVVLYEMILGETHSKGYSDAQLIIKAQSGQYDHIGSLVQGLPLGLDLAIMKALSPDRDNRFPSARTFRNALDIIVKREGLEVSSEAVASYIQGIFNTPFSKGSRVEEVEQLSGGNIVVPLPPLPPGNPPDSPRASSGGYDYYGKSEQSFSNHDIPVLPPSLRTPPKPAAGVVPVAAAGYSNDNEGVAPPPPVSLDDIDPNPVGLSKSTSAKGRERRRLARLKKKEALEKKQLEQEQAIASRDVAAIPKKPHKPVIVPFLQRFGNALVATFVNIFLGIALIGIFIGVYKFAFNKKSDTNEESSSITHKPTSKRCTKGEVFLNIKSIPSDGDILLDGLNINAKTPLVNGKFMMCYNKPLKIRVVKGNLVAEKSVDYPINSSSYINITLRLRKGLPLQKNDVNPGAHNYNINSSGTRHSHRKRSPSSTMKKDNNSEVDYNSSPDGALMAGGIGILKVTCNKPCNVVIDNKNKGAKKSIRLRARKRPYSVKAIFKDNFITSPKKVYIIPNENNFIHFSR